MHMASVPTTFYKSHMCISYDWWKLTVPQNQPCVNIGESLCIDFEKYKFILAYNIIYIFQGEDIRYLFSC